MNTLTFIKVKRYLSDPEYQPPEIWVIRPYAEFAENIRRPLLRIRKNDGLLTALQFMNPCVRNNSCSRDSCAPCGGHPDSPISLASVDRHSLNRWP